MGPRAGPSDSPKLAAVFVALRADIVVSGGSGVPAAKKAIDAIPIIMARYDDADARRQVASIARPGAT
jgi:hypothetical protein